MVLDHGALKSLMLLWQRVALEEATWCRTSTLRDYETVTRRCEDEGWSFLTITLPNFGKDFERSLDQGAVTRNLFQGFSWKAGLPKFLRGFLELIFAVDSGIMVDEPSVDAIRAVRQLTLMFGKINLVCSEERRDAAIKGFVDCEKSVLEADGQRSHDDYVVFHRVARLLFANVLSEVDRKVFDGEVVPKHGPGATADRLKGNQKFVNRTWTNRLESAGLLAGEFLFSSASHYIEGIDHVTWLEPGAEPPVRVVDVPKTQKAPRIIAIEPSWMQYCQQSLLEPIRQGLEEGDSRSNFVGLTDQTPNQRLAREGSLTGRLATLDLSEASDRVSYQLVQTLLADHPHLAMAVDATRSKLADVPGFGVMPLAKFASMGSALTFPIEAMVFTTCIFVGIEKALRRPVTMKDIAALRGEVRVYGDDIVVPVEFVQSVISTLESFGFKVNMNKSFWTGRFRESCGKEYFNGEDVSIVRVREVFPTTRKNVREVISTVSLRNQLYKAGLWATAFYLADTLRGVIPLPVVSETSAVLGQHSYVGYETHVLSRHTQAPRVKGWTARAVLPKNSIDGVPALLKGFILKRGYNDPLDEGGQLKFLADYLVQSDDHLDRSGRPIRVDMTYGRHSPY